MIPEGTTLEIGQTLTKVRNGNKLGYMIIEITHKYSEGIYSYKYRGKDKTSSLRIDKSDDYYLTKAEFFKFIYNTINDIRRKSDKIDPRYRTPYSPERYVEEQVLIEIDAHMKNSPEYWI